MPIVTYIIIGLTVIVSLQAFNDTSIYHRFIFNPYLIHERKQWYRFFTHALIHADWNHLLFNMLSLYFFGPSVERTYKLVFGPLQGTLFYMLLYISSIMMASLYSYEKNKANMYYNAVGASGAVCAIIFAWILFYPFGLIYVFFIPIGIYGFIYGILTLFIESYLGRRGGTGIAHDAHFWGAVYGFVLTVVFKWKLFFLFIDQIRDYFNGMH